MTNTDRIHQILYDAGIALTTGEIAARAGLSRKQANAAIRKLNLDGWAAFAGFEGNRNGPRLWACHRRPKKQQPDTPAAIVGAQLTREYLASLPELERDDSDLGPFEVRSPNEYGYVVINRAWSRGWAELLRQTMGGKIVRV